MNTAYIVLLEKRIAGLDDKDFDLEVWKSGTALLLTRIFGDKNSYSVEIEDLKVDYSSWSLRDATSTYNPKVTARRMGREILELAIAELQLSEENQTDQSKINEIVNEVNADISNSVAKKDVNALTKLLNKETKDRLIQLLTRLLVR